MLLSPHVQDDGLVVLVGRDGDHAGLAVVPVHGHRGVSPVLKPVITHYNPDKMTSSADLMRAADPLLTSSPVVLLAATIGWLVSDTVWLLVTWTEQHSIFTALFKHLRNRLFTLF